jgi:hypothetical protein
VNSLHIKRINIEDLVGYVYIVRVDTSIYKDSCSSQFSEEIEHNMIPSASFYSSSPA